VIALGTFAKLVAPGLRVGWVAATPEIIGKMGALKSDGGSCPSLCSGTAGVPARARQMSRLHY
jgi:DNA-binding transcriptional MocR family regulator